MGGDPQANRIVCGEDIPGKRVGWLLSCGRRGNGEKANPPPAVPTEWEQNSGKLKLENE